MLARLALTALALVSADAARADVGPGRSYALDDVALQDVALYVAAELAGLDAVDGLNAPTRVQDDDDGSTRRRRRSSDDADDRDRDRDDGSSFGDGGSGGAYSPMGRPFGIGLQLGAPTAVTVKYFLVDNQALVGGIGVGSGWDYYPGLSIHVDYLWHPSMLTTAAPFNLSWYIGGGGWLAVNTTTGRRPYVVGYGWYGLPTAVWLGARLPIGVDLALRNVPFEIYAEAAPALLIFPALTFGIGFAIGGRFYF